LVFPARGIKIKIFTKQNKGQIGSFIYGLGKSSPASTPWRVITEPLGGCQKQFAVHSQQQYFKHNMLIANGLIDS
jgi:hypothetical protein